MDKVRICFGLFMACIYGCNEGAGGGQRDVKEFEGVITYRIAYRNKDFSSVFGDTMKVYYSKGRLARLYNGRGEKALSKEVVLMASHRCFYGKRMSDTVSVSDITKDGNFELVNTKRTSDDTRILGQVCRRMEIDQVYKGTEKFHLYGIFLYASDVLQVDKRYFKDWNLFQFNRFIDEAGSLYLKFELKILDDKGMEHWATTFTAVEIKEQRVDSSVFYIDTSVTKPMQF